MESSLTSHSTYLYNQINFMTSQGAIKVFQRIGPVTIPQSSREIYMYKFTTSLLVGRYRSMVFDDRRRLMVGRWRSPISKYVSKNGLHNAQKVCKYGIVGGPIPIW